MRPNLDLMQWNPIIDSKQIEAIKAASFTKPQLILKHSTTCSISKMALARLERADTPNNIDFHYLDLLNYRNTVSYTHLTLPTNREV